MSAYVVVEASVRDPEARDRYGSQIGPVLKQFGGEILAFGPWQLLFGEPAYHNGMIITIRRPIKLCWIFATPPLTPASA